MLYKGVNKRKPSKLEELSPKILANKLEGKNFDPRKCVEKMCTFNLVQRPKKL